MDDYKIRKAVLSDADRIAEIYNQHLGKATMHLKKVSADYYRTLLRALSDREEMHVLTCENKVVGWSIIKLYSPKEGYAHACETSTFFDGDYSGKGYGRKLKNHMFMMAKKLDYTYIVARIMSVNKGSIQFHVRLGYCIVGEQKNIGTINGRKYNVTLLEKHLD